MSIPVNRVGLALVAASMMAMPVRAQSLAQRVRAVGTGVAEVHSRFVGATSMELLVDAASG